MGTYSVDMVAMFFGMSFALFPAYATEFGGAEVLGILYGALGRLASRNGDERVDEPCTGTVSP